MDLNYSRMFVCIAWHDKGKVSSYLFTHIFTYRDQAIFMTDML